MPPGKFCPEASVTTQRPLVVLQAPPHAEQDCPPVPQALADCEAYDTQVLPLQHPLGHVLASHLQTPLTHFCVLVQPMPHIPQLFWSD